MLGTRPIGVSTGLGINSDIVTSNAVGKRIASRKPPPMETTSEFRRARIAIAAQRIGKPTAPQLDLAKMPKAMSPTPASIKAYAHQSILVWGGRRVNACCTSVVGMVEPGKPQALHAVATNNAFIPPVLRSGAPNDPVFASRALRGKCNRVAQN
jgi:hypothetical protein